MFYVAFFVLLCVAPCSSAIRSTCEVNISDKEFFALLTCRFSKPVKEFLLELKRSTDGNSKALGFCNSKSCTGQNTNYTLIPNKEEYFHNASVGILRGTDSPEGNYSCVPMDTSDTHPDVQVCHLSSPKGLTVSSEHAPPAVRLMSTCTVNVVEEGAVHVLSCSFTSETNSYLVELSFSTGPGLEVQCTRNQCNSSESYVFKPSQNGNNSQAEVRIELPLQQRAGRVEYRCVPHDVRQVQTTGCSANFLPPSVTSEVSTTDKVPGKDAHIPENKGTHFDALLHIIVTSCFIGITTIAVVVALVVAIRLLRRRVIDKQQWANNVFSGLSAPRASGPTHHESGNIYDEIPSRQWHKELISIETVGKKDADAVISRYSLPAVIRDNSNNLHEISKQIPAALSDSAPEDNPHSILHQQNSLKSMDIVRSTSLPPFDLQTNMISLPSESSIVSSSLPPSQRSSSPLSSDSSSSYLHPVSEVSIKLDFDLDVRARQRALYQVLDCGYLDFKVCEALPKPCSPRMQRVVRKMETNHNRRSQ